MNAFGYANAELEFIGSYVSARSIPMLAATHRFGAVDVVAEIEDDMEIDIDEKEIREDTYRGQWQRRAACKQDRFSGSAYPFTDGNCGRLPDGAALSTKTDRLQ